MFEFETEINCGPCGVRHLHLCRSFTYMFIIYFFVLFSNIYTLCLWLTSSQITYLFIIDFVICTSGSIINLFIIYFFILFSNIYTGVSVSIISLFVIDFFVLLSNINTGVSVSIISLFIIDFFVLLSNIYTGVTVSQVHRSQSFNFSLLTSLYFFPTFIQVALVHKFPPESNPALWLRLRPTKGLAPELAQDVEYRLVTWTLRVLTPSTGSVKASQLVSMLLESKVYGLWHNRKTEASVQRHSPFATENSNESNLK